MIQKLIDEELEDLEQEMHGILVARGVISNTDSIRGEVEKVTKGVTYLSERFNRWWTHLHYGQINLLVPSTSPLNRVLEAFEVNETVLNIPIETAIENGFIAESIEDRRQAIILSALWNEAIAWLRGSGALRHHPT